MMRARFPIVGHGSLCLRVMLPALLLVCCGALGAETWRGLVVADEARCTEYKSGDYRHSDVELAICEDLGGCWSPYDGTRFPNQESDIEHIVAKSEAHDSGLCAADAETRKRFANDLDNLTLATPALNRHKGGGDAADWCWFAGRVLVVRLEYGLTVDQAEADALDTVLQGCTIEQVLRPQPVGMVPKG